MTDLQRLRAKLAQICTERAQHLAATIGPDGPGSPGEGRLIGESRAYHDCLRMVDELANGYGWAAPNVSGGDSDGKA